MSNILHICADFAGSEVYSHLLRTLSRRGADNHTMYVPMYADIPVGRHANDRADIDSGTARVIYSKDHWYYDRLLRRRKNRRIAEGVQRTVDMRAIDFIHAHYLFSGGGAAIRLQRRFGTPYVVAVRNTDANYFLKYAVHLRALGVEIMLRADRVVFISPCHQRTVLAEYIPARHREVITQKSCAIPNGVDAFWLDAAIPSTRNPSCTLHLLFVGEFRTHKNVGLCIRAVSVLRRNGHDARLVLIGDGPEMPSLRRLATPLGQGVVEFAGWIHAKEELRRRYEAADIFVMPSLKETFGVVYVEALSCGLPIVYGRGQGIDGYFEDGIVGYGCDPRNAEHLAECIVRIRENYDVMSRNATAAAARFCWDRVAEEYEALYLSINRDRDDTNQSVT